ncbi:MAG TPA: carboxypeptidase-like regulatory domain-containing protein, partial [Bryobacteraceae bacterium]|nr:carboxypeptidase-like regulatory domain-containing protein [Bryobacteraceae bacterium]
MPTLSLRILAGTLLLSFAAAAQNADTGTLVSGSIQDPAMMAVMNAEAAIRNPATGYRQTVVSDDKGEFRFNNVPPNGMYELTIIAPGFAPVKEPLEV